MNKKVLDVKRIQTKAVKKLKKSFEGTGVVLSEQAEKEILRAIRLQSEENLEEIIAENLAIHIADELNLKIRKDQPGWQS